MIYFLILNKTCKNTPKRNLNHFYFVTIDADYYVCSDNENLMNDYAYVRLDN